MRYWWVNQNQTYRHEIDGGYLWSPKRNKNGNRNPFYEFMREVSPGDIVFSFCDTYIRAIGIVNEYCRESPKPAEFANTGANWSQIGWKVGVRWSEIRNLIRPKEHIERLRSELTSKYSPLTPDGNGLQSVYLTEISRALAAALFSIIGAEANRVEDVAEKVKAVEHSTPALESDVEEWERRVEVQISQDSQIADTDRRALVMARRGQGLFRTNVRQIEKFCRITKVDRPEHLLASHAKPWRDSSNAERLDGENGLLLTPAIDHLFDGGFISFEDRGRLIVSPIAHAPSLERMGVNCHDHVDVGEFSEGQRRYLDYHRNNILRMAQIKR